MKDRIIEMLGRDERVELECVDEEAMIASNKSYADVLLSMPLIVSHIFTNKIVFESGLFIRENKLKYFKIKEPKYTFNYLIDVAIQAYKDGVVDKVLIEDAITIVSKSHKTAIFGLYKTDINFREIESIVRDIESLYNETFVIESEEDEMKIRQPVKSIILANGEEIINEDRLSLLQDGLCLKAGAAGNIKIPFPLLKGATVTQKRGNQCNK